MRTLWRILIGRAVQCRNCGLYVETRELETSQATPQWDDSLIETSFTHRDCGYTWTKTRPDPAATWKSINAAAERPGVGYGSLDGFDAGD